MTRFLLTCTLNLLTIVIIYINCLLVHTTIKSQLSLASLCNLVGYVVQRRILKIMKRNEMVVHPEGLISFQIRQVKFSNLRLKSNGKNHNTVWKKNILLVVTYHPWLESLSAIINKNLSNLHMDKNVKRVPTSQPVVSFCSAHKLNSYVVRAKLYPLEKTLFYESVRVNDTKFEKCYNLETSSRPFCVYKELSTSSTGKWNFWSKLLVLDMF